MSASSDAVFFLKFPGGSSGGAGFQVKRKKEIKKTRFLLPGGSSGGAGFLASFPPPPAAAAPSLPAAAAAASCAAAAAAPSGVAGAAGVCVSPACSLGARGLETRDLSSAAPQTLRSACVLR